jgi:CheY-like chemotaxis protein
MIVDEHWANIPVYKRLLAEFPGSHVVCFPDAAGAYHECALHIPDILVIDDDVPKIAPLTFARRFRQRATLNEPLIIMLGARDGRLAEHARRCGVDVFLPKPIDTKYFLAMFHRAAELRTARIQLAAYG